MAAAMVATAVSALPLSRADSPHTLQLGLRGSAVDLEESEACRAMLQRLRRVAGQYREQFEVLSHDPGDAQALLRRTRGLLRAMEAEANDALGVEGVRRGREQRGGRAGSPGRSLELLRRSLGESQRRCDDAGAHVAQQAQANEELAQSLAAVRDTNRRYAEQLRSQDGEVAQLRHQSAAEEERIEAAHRCHCQEQDALQEDRRRRVLSVREAAAAKCEAAESELGSKLKRARSCLETVTTEVAGLKHVQTDDLRGAMGETQAHIRKFEQAASGRLADYVARHTERKSLAERTARELHTRLAHHTTVRNLEGADCARRHVELVHDRDALQSQSEGEIGRAASQRQALDRALAAERSSHVGDVTRFEQQCEECIRQREQHEIALDSTRHDIAQLQSLASASLAELGEKEKTLSQLRRQTRESDDALASAMSCSEHLREQVEEQQRRMDDMLSVDLSVLQKAHDYKTAQVCEEYEKASSDLNGQLRALEAEEGLQTNKIAESQAMLHDLDSRCAEFRRDLDGLKRSYELHGSLREEHESKTAEGRKRFAQESLSLKTALEDLGPRHVHVKAELKNATEELSCVRREATATDAELASRVNTMEGRLRDAQAQLADARFRLSEADALVMHARSEAEAEERKAAEARDALERELEQRGRRAHDERKQLELQLDAERQQMLGSRQLARQKLDSHESSMRKVQEDQSVRLGAMEREHARADDAYRSHMAQSQRELREQTVQLDALAHDIDRVRGLLAESQQQLQQLHREREREERESQLGRRRLEDEIRQTHASLEALRGSEASLRGQLESGGPGRLSGQSGEVLELRRRLSAQRSEADARLQRLSEEHQSSMQAADLAHREAISAKQKRHGDITRENDRLRQMMFSDARPSSPHPSRGRIQQRDLLCERREP